MCGEPIFVTKPNSEEEDDGVLLTVVLFSKSEASSLVVLDAKSMTEAAVSSRPLGIDSADAPLSGLISKCRSAQAFMGRSLLSRCE